LNPESALQVACQINDAALREESLRTAVEGTDATTREELLRSGELPPQAVMALQDRAAKR
jgi:hypothetical protein